MNSEILTKDCEEIISNVGLENLSRFDNKTVLITGSAGFIGQSLALLFLHLNENYKKNIKLVLLDSKKYLHPEIASLAKKYKVKLVAHNLLEKIKIKYDADFVFHLASVISPKINSEKPVDSFLVNVLGTENILNSLKTKKISKFVYFSSGGIYGNPDKKNIPTPEDFNGNVSSISSRACYAEGKRAGETLTMSYFNQYGLPINIVRPAHIFGPLMNLAGDNAISYFFDSCLKKKDIILKSKGQETRALCYISDAISIVLKAVIFSDSGQVFNVGNEKNEIKIVNLVNLIADAFGKTSKVKFAEKDTAAFYKEPMHRNNLSMKKVKNILKFTPKVSIKEGVGRIIKFYE